LYREEGREFDIAWVQFDLDDRIAKRLKPDEAAIRNGEGSRIIIRIEVAQSREECRAPFEDPLAIRRDQHGYPFHGDPRSAGNRLAGANPSPACYRWMVKRR
jgi:hypothetical protein